MKLKEYGLFNINDRVVFVDKKSHREKPEYYPEVETVGKIVDIRYDIHGNPTLLLVQWPAGSTSLNDLWYCDVYKVVNLTQK